MEIDVRANTVFRAAIRATAKYSHLPDACIYILLNMDYYYRTSNYPFIDRKVVMDFAGYQKSSLNVHLNSLLHEGYIVKRGGQKMSIYDSKKLERFNKTQYALKGLASVPIMIFNQQYSRLMEKPLPVSYGYGFPRGSKRIGQRGKKMIEGINL